MVRRFSVYLRVRKKKKEGSISFLLSADLKMEDRGDLTTRRQRVLQVFVCPMSRTTSEVVVSRALGSYVQQQLIINLTILLSSLVLSLLLLLALSLLLLSSSLLLLYVVLVR